MTPGTFEQNEALDPEDERLLEELRRAAGRYDPPPAWVMEAARSSLTWRTIDAELAAHAVHELGGRPDLVRHPADDVPQRADRLGAHEGRRARAVDEDVTWLQHLDCLLGGHLGNDFDRLGCFGRLLDAQPAEETQLDDLSLLRVENGELVIPAAATGEV